ncbi:hypothetical protein AVEN_184001-1 [Araneus ventricosus]|uniref:Uncharacterized protein n=1 Tax=Araneus ventricosus TaxID=182803 RepID=A0A4Y2E1Q1_ARAVE|nr:hypothetical protein AVEN_184001-1 [Araneus ventricosus]
MVKIYSYLDGKNDCKYFVDELMRQISGERPTRSTLRQKMKKKYGECIVFSTVFSRKSVVFFRGAGEKILNHIWCTWSNEKTKRERIVRTAGLNTFHIITPPRALPPVVSNKKLKSVSNAQKVGKLGVLELLTSENVMTRVLQQIVVKVLNMQHPILSKIFKPCLTEILWMSTKCLSSQENIPGL